MAWRLTFWFETRKSIGFLRDPAPRIAAKPTVTVDGARNAIEGKRDSDLRHHVEFQPIQTDFIRVCA